MELSKEEREEVERMKQIIRSQMMKHPTKEEIKKKQEQERIKRRRENQVGDNAKLRRDHTKRRKALVML